jgi:hypothetical protein
VRVDINLPQFLLLMFFILNPVDLPWILFVFMYQLGTSETFLCFTVVHLKKIVYARCVIRCPNEVFKYSFVFCISFIYVVRIVVAVCVLLLLLDIWLLIQHVVHKSCAY